MKLIILIWIKYNKYLKHSPLSPYLFFTLIHFILFYFWLLLILFNFFEYGVPLNKALINKLYLDCWLNLNFFENGVYVQRLVWKYFVANNMPNTFLWPTHYAYSPMAYGLLKYYFTWFLYFIFIFYFITRSF